jgi:catechol 2,3-dioxygenase-like lactoylglutathione lyase family enzyme
MNATPLDHAALFHTGIVVDDLDAAKEELGVQLGVTWHEGGGEVLLVTADGAALTQTAYVLSKAGPHHIELVQSVPGTLYAPTPAARAHHLGYWTDDVRAASAALEAQGLPLDTSMCFGSPEAPPICAYHRAGDGFFVELVSTKMRKVLLPDG